MNNLTKIGCLLLVFLPLSGAKAVEIPDYITQIDDVAANICPIINNLSSRATGATSAEADARVKQQLRRELAAAAYGQAIATRAQLQQQAFSNMILDAALSVIIKDKKKIMADKIQPALISIAERLNSIVSMEASIAALEGTMMFTDLPKDDTDVFERCSQKDEEEK